MIKEIFKAGSISLMLMHGCYALAADHQKGKVGVIGYTDHLTINLEKYEVGFKLLNINKWGLDVHFEGCQDGVNCKLTIEGFSGTAAVTIGSDFGHSCQFFISDGAFQEHPTYFKPPLCSGGRGADEYIHQDHGYYYSTKMW